MRKREKKHVIENSKEIPLVGGKREWNAYDVDNSILHHSKQEGTHPSLVLVEYDGKVLVAELNHTDGPMKKRIKNPDTKDAREASYLKRKTVVSKDKSNVEPITIKDLKTKRNDRSLSKEEKQDILTSLNNKKVNRVNMRVLVELKKNKKSKK